MKTKLSIPDTMNFSQTVKLTVSRFPEMNWALIKTITTNKSPWGEFSLNAGLELRAEALLSANTSASAKLTDCITRTENY